MTREDYAKDINYTAKQLVRTIIVDTKLDLNEGDLYDNRGIVESWSCEDCTSNFEPLDDGIEYSFFVKNVECHKVNYNDKEELKELGAIDCEDEGECLILSTQKFRIVSVATDEDYEEMGYYEVDLEVVK